MSQQTLSTIASRDLAAKKCTSCDAGGSPLEKEKVTAFLAVLSAWERVGAEISRTFAFKNYYQTMAFVNAIAWVSHQEDHHPDLEVKYNQCRVRYSTHSVGGLSENDFICAAKVDALFAPLPPG